MAFQQAHTYAERSGTDESQGLTVTTSAEGRINLGGPNNPVIAAGNATTEVSMTVAVHAIKAFFLRVSDACVVKTNSASEPDNSLTFTQAGVYVWDASSPQALVITEDIEALFVTVGGEADVDVIVRCLYDPTAPPPD